MRAEFTAIGAPDRSEEPDEQPVQPDVPDTVVGVASWDGRDVRVDHVEPAYAEALDRIFRPVPVVIDDPAHRSVGSNGPTLLEPGDLRWFIAAATSRAEREGLAARLVATGEGGIGWDPAGAYRTFGQAVERRNRIGSAGA